MLQEKKEDITAYSIYNVEQKKRTKINPLEEIYPKLPEKKYQVIYDLYKESILSGICINNLIFMQIHLGIMVEKCNMIKQR